MAPAAGYVPPRCHIPLAITVVIILSVAKTKYND